LVISAKTKGGNSIEAEFSIRTGFDFYVNGEFDVGQIKNRREQIEVALKVKQMYDAIARSLPTDTIIRTRAYTSDGKGDARTKAYIRMGFSPPKDAGGYMYAQKGADGTMSPAEGGKDAHVTQRDNPDSMFFSEKNLVSSVKNWIQIIFGLELR
jgi:hypothetical protein